MITEDDIVYDNGAAFVMRERAAGPLSARYTVCRQKRGFSVTDSSYELTKDGLSLAKARADWLKQQKGKR